MKIDFSNGRVTLAVAGVDMRKSYQSLAALAASALIIDVSKGRDWVVFISKRRKIAKIIHGDDKGGVMITRYLDTGTFQQLMTKVQGLADEPLTAAELESYLDGEKIRVVPAKLRIG